MRQNTYLRGQGSAPDSAQELTVCGAIGSLAVFNERVREEGGERREKGRRVDEKRRRVEEKSKRKGERSEGRK